MEYSIVPKTPMKMIVQTIRIIQCNSCISWEIGVTPGVTFS